MKKIFLSLLAIFVCVPAATWLWQSLRNEDNGVAAPATVKAEQIVRGAYLTRAANCIVCHTPRGALPYAGGRAMSTPFGTLYSPNITPDKETGIGRWTSDDFWRALHHGRGKDGRFLYPAFPYPSYTKMTRDDSDAMFAYLQSIPGVKQPNAEHQLRFPYNQRWLLAGWRAFYFSPGEYQVNPQQTANWNRGAYLVQGPGHCMACHSARNSLGANVDGDQLGGGLIGSLGWYGPALTSDKMHGLGRWETDDLAAFLKTGNSPQGAALGPMAEVVSKSLQYLNDDDVQAMAVYLKSLPPAAPPDEHNAPQPEAAEAERIMTLGKKLYTDLCIDCHKVSGNGIAPDYPPLNGNNALTSGSPVNAIRLVLNGGFPPSTAGNPYPFSMPPFGPRLSDTEVAAVVSYIRNSWDNKAGFVSPAEVNRYRSVPAD